MTKKFVASNRYVVTGTPTGSVEVVGRLFPANLTGETARALREFFLAERDEELGRWRWPEYPEWVVYKEVNSLGHHVVLNEKTTYKVGVSRADVEGSTDMSYGMAAAKTFFETHPEPKPWHDAKQNEIWVLQIKDCHTPEVYRFAQYTTCADPCVFRPVNNPGRVFFDPQSTLIVQGRRIWPEGENNDE